MSNIPPMQQLANNQHLLPADPKDLSLLLSTLQKNLLYQRFLHHQLDRVHDLHEVNCEKTRAISRLIQHVSTTSTNNQLHRSVMHSHAIPQRTIFAAPWFVDDYGFQPPSNADSSTFIDSITNLPLYPNYIALNKRVPMTPYHFYTNPTTTIEQLSPPLPQQLPPDIQSILTQTKIPMAPINQIPSQIIPKMEFVSPRLSHSQFIALWRGIITASYEFHTQQLNTLNQYEQMLTQFTTTTPSLPSSSPISTQQPPTHPYFSLQIEDIISACGGGVPTTTKPNNQPSTNDNNDITQQSDEIEFELPNPSQIYEFLTGVQLHHSLGLNQTSSLLHSSQSSSPPPLPSASLSTSSIHLINPLQHSKPFFDPNNPIDVLFILSIMRSSNLIDDSLSPISSNNNNNDSNNDQSLPLPQLLLQTPVSWLSSSFARLTYQHYFTFYHLTQFHHSQQHSAIVTSTQSDVTTTTTLQPNFSTPPNSLLISYNTCKELNISTFSESARAPPTDLSTELVNLHQTLSEKWHHCFQQQYPYPQIPLQFINFNYIAQHVVKQGSTAVLCYCHAFNYREPFINEPILVTLILYFYWYYDFHISNKYFSILNAHFPDMITNNLSYNSSLPQPIELTELCQSRLDLTLSDQDIINILLCQTDLQRFIILKSFPSPTQIKYGNLLAVDFRIPLSFPIIFELYTRAINIIDNSTDLNQSRFYSIFSQTPINLAWSNPKNSINQAAFTSIFNFFTATEHKSTIKDTIATITLSTKSTRAYPFPRQPSIFQLQRLYTMMIEPTLAFYCKWTPMINTTTISDTLVAIAKHYSQLNQKQLHKSSQLIHENNVLQQQQFLNSFSIPFFMSKPYLPSVQEQQSPHINIIYLPSTCHVDLEGIDVNPLQLLNSIQLDQIKTHQHSHLAAQTNYHHNNQMIESQFKLMLDSIQQSNHFIFHHSSPLSPAVFQVTNNRNNSIGTHMISEIYLNFFSTSFPTIIPSSLFRILINTDLGSFYDWIARLSSPSSSTTTPMSASSSTNQPQQSFLNPLNFHFSPPLLESKSSTSITNWSFEEDLRLILAVKAHTRQIIQPYSDPIQLETTISWQDVATHLPNKNARQCRQHYLFVLARYVPTSNSTPTPPTSSTHDQAEEVEE